jgi:hypothetical protein
MIIVRFMEASLGYARAQVNNRGAAWVKKGDRGRALQDYAEARPP